MGAALRGRVTDGEGGFSKRYLREFGIDIRFDGKTVTMQDKKRRY